MRIHRLYDRPGHHNLRHIGECLALFDEIAESARSPRALEFAIWLHDIVYHPTQGDCERRSAQMAGMMLKELGEEPLAEPVKRMIIATEHNREDVEGDERLIVDVDLAILGSVPSRYDEYASQIREEFHFVGDDEYRAGRLAVLRRFLSRDSIFRTPLLHERFEKRARSNLNREIGVLSGDS